MNDLANSNLDVFLAYIPLTTYLDISVPFLLQKFTKEQFIEYRDEHGWSFLHWLVAYGKSSKMCECIDFGFDLDLQSSHSSLPVSFLEKHPQNWNKYTIHQKGFTPLHLNVILHSEYSDIDDNSKRKIDIHNKKEEQKNIFHNISSNYLTLEDADGLSITDYCFMFENIELIHLVMTKDPTFNSLQQVTTETALNIIQNYLKYHNFSLYHESQEWCKDIIVVLQKKIEYEKLNHELSTNCVIESKGKI